ncbi:hypothetical protein OIU78_007419 [Salix suchowensis]|nr:hypothetical protein OIU78_007419 [Salix suchowensis]
MKPQLPLIRKQIISFKAQYEKKLVDAQSSLWHIEYPTVIDNDLILVLDDGKVVEYDSPVKLLKDGSSSFSKLVVEFLRRSIQE